MSFKSQFSASSEKAHNRIIATKIYDELTKLRAGADASPTMSKRWVWELIQNAKDVNIGGKVRVRIEAELDHADAHVTFQHNGGPFSAENIRFLIEQVSSKDRTYDPTGRPTTTGRFGTGFLTTHLLSERVIVTGVTEGSDFSAREFKLSLDRSGEDLEDIIDAVQAAKNSLQDLDDRPSYTGYTPGAFNTAFRYQLDDKTGKNVARAGLADLDICLPYTLAFVRELESVEYLNRLSSLEEPEEDKVDGEVQILDITVVNSGRSTKPEVASIAIVSCGLTTIAVPVEQTSNGVQILPLAPNVPRLFCDFPLLGTEAFPFPVIINNPTFNPTEPRDGIFLTRTERPNAKIDHNKTILKEALALYLSLLSHASENEWQNLHLLAGMKIVGTELNKIDQDWYQAAILTPMRQTLQRTRIVRTAANTLAAIHPADGSKNIWFPSGSSKQVRRAIWCCCKNWIPAQLPALSDVEIWNDIIWPECNKLTLDKIAELVEKCGTIEILQGELDGTDVRLWLMNFYATSETDETGFLAVVAKRAIFPNQNGTFRRKADLTRDAADIDVTLLDILKLLGDDLRAQLLDVAITTELEDFGTTNEAFVIKEISATIEEKINDRAAMKRIRPALEKFLLWFREYPSKAEMFFPMLYGQKHLLYDDEQILENIERAEELSALLSEYNVKNVAEFRAVIDRHAASSQLLPVTQQIIASLGITSVEEWTKALEDKNLAAMFSHESTTTPEMFVLAQSLIGKAKGRVIKYLSTLDEYDLTDMDETALTILAGVRKDGRDVTIVVRPAYDGTVIIYYQSERDVLDYVDHELWVDTVDDVRRITFGHILKTSEIRRFPV